MDITLNARWTHDCMGKQDLDFGVIDCRTRYWPTRGFEQQVSAFCEIILMDNFCINATSDEDPYVKSEIKPIILMESGYLKADSEEEMKSMVKDWYNNNIIKAMEQALELIKDK